MRLFLLLSILASTWVYGAPLLDTCIKLHKRGEWQKALSACEPLAKAGNVEGMYYLAKIFGRKNSDPIHEKNRIHWLENAAERGHYMSQALLATHYSFDKFNREKAEFYHVAAALHDNVIALNSAGRFYRIRNDDILKSTALSNEEKETLLQERWQESFKWHHRAAELGDARGQINVGDLYKNGMGVEQNWVKAIEWYKKAAQQGEKNAYYRLGALYLHGVAIKDKAIFKQDLAKAYAFIKAASELWGHYGDVDIGAFDAFIAHPLKPLPWKDTYRKHHWKPKEDLKSLKHRLNAQLYTEGEHYLEKIHAGSPPL